VRPVKTPLDLHVHRNKETPRWKRDGGGDEMEGGEIMHFDVLSLMTFKTSPQSLYILD
jgi:hypothetical protein